MAKKITAVVKLQLPAGKATPGPPVGSTLGPHGINITVTPIERAVPLIMLIALSSDVQFRSGSFCFAISSTCAPVGSTLGPHGINIPGFTKEFNAKTANQEGLIIPGLTPAAN